MSVDSKLTRPYTRSEDLNGKNGPAKRQRNKTEPENKTGNHRTDSNIVVRVFYPTGTELIKAGWRKLLYCRCFVILSTEKLTSPPSTYITKAMSTSIPTPTIRTTSSASTTPLNLWSMLLLHLVVFCPYFISTVLVMSLYRHRLTGNYLLVSRATTEATQDVVEVVGVTTENHV
ncbi:hypothetical protein Q8A73_012554 [Channa argus]|nr:hypothetical protein Q8A73_012554 [Channa argus]